MRCGYACCCLFFSPVLFIFPGQAGVMTENTSLITIEGKGVERVEYRGQPVITFRMIDELHQRPDGTARKTFNRNRKYFIDNEDFFEVPYEEWSRMIAVPLTDGDQIKQRNSIKFLTQSGYLMVVKAFRDDLSWKIQRILVQSYFIVREKIEAAAREDISLGMLADRITEAMRLAEALGLRGKQAARYANNAVKNMTGYDCIALMDGQEFFSSPEELPAPESCNTREPVSEPTPMQAVVCFVEELCEVGTGFRISRDELFCAYTRYCSENSYTIQDDFEFLGLLFSSVPCLRIEEPDIAGIHLRLDRYCLLDTAL